MSEHSPESLESVELPRIRRKGGTVFIPSPREAAKHIAPHVKALTYVQGKREVRAEARRIVFGFLDGTVSREELRRFW